MKGIKFSDRIFNINFKKPPKMVPLLILVIVVIWEFWEHVFILSLKLKPLFM